MDLTLALFSFIAGTVAVTLTILFQRWRLRRATQRPSPEENRPELGFSEEGPGEPEPEPEEEPYLDVYLNGMLLLAGEDYTIDPEGERVSFPHTLRARDVIQLHTRRSRRVITIEENMEAGSSVRMTPGSLPSPVRHLEFEEGEPVQRQERPGAGPSATGVTGVLEEEESDQPIPGSPPGDGWVRINPANIALQKGDPIEYGGRNYWAVDIEQDFNPGGHFTYAKLEPMLVPRSR